MLSSKRTQGFSLIELLAVIVIIVILSAMMVPVFDSGLASARTRGDLGRIVQMANLCTSLAAEHREPYRLYIQPETRRLWIAFQPDPLEQRGTFQPLRATKLSTLELDEEVAFRTFQLESVAEDEERDEEDLFIEFQPNGTNDGGVLVLETATGEVYSIVISSMTGRVRLLEFDLVQQREEAMT